VSLSPWEYNDMVHIGKDFASREVAKAYDAKHRRLRDIEKENEAVIAALGRRGDHVVADIGCGTGAFVLMAARRCAWYSPYSPLSSSWVRSKVSSGNLHEANLFSFFSMHDCHAANSLYFLFSIAFVQLVAHACGHAPPPLSL
jgi:hypothetical protein